ncbi:helix-turn-helix domain-containing protein [Pseudonocardia dioxanivorans]|uniref:helix-turn-helix domain-containing protein n=1 Tax=Pseudonocardia dioxanivorans TaxID=240495 RepID=UPI000CD07661|nr:helix-turn-helix transcriptional regulator [Pseudonocardia dioxanivorans]
MPEEEELRAELASRLRQLRADAGLSGVAAGRRAGISQPMVSRWERGRNVPDPQQAADYATALGAADDSRDVVVSLATRLDEVREQNIPARVVLSRGAADFQRRVGRLEQGARHVRTFTPTVVPGLLQTEEYARAIFGAGGFMTDADVDEAVNARLDRQRLLGSDGSRRFTLLMTEGALRWMAVSPAVMVRQLDRITATVNLPHVAVGIIEWTTPVDVFPMHGWDLYDDTAAVVGTETATGLITDRRDLEQYGQLFDRLNTLASKDDALIAALARLRSEYSRLG